MMTTQISCHNSRPTRLCNLLLLIGLVLAGPAVSLQAQAQSQAQLPQLPSRLPNVGHAGLRQPNTALVQVRSDRGMVGVGFVIAAGKIITNVHVAAKGGRNLQVVYFNGVKDNVDVVYGADYEWDAVVLGTSGTPAGIRPLELHNLPPVDFQPIQGLVVDSTGYQAAFDSFVINTMRYEVAPQPIPYITSLPSGSSGSPLVLPSTNKVIGLSGRSGSFGRVARFLYGAAVPSAVLQRLLSQERISLDSWLAEPETVVFTKMMAFRKQAQASRGEAVKAIERFHQDADLNRDPQAIHIAFSTLKALGRLEEAEALVSGFMSTLRQTKLQGRRLNLRTQQIELAFDDMQASATLNAARDSNDRATLRRAVKQAEAVLMRDTMVVGAWLTLGVAAHKTSDASQVTAALTAMEKIDALLGTANNDFTKILRQQIGR